MGSRSYRRDICTDIYDAQRVGEGGRGGRGSAAVQFMGAGRNEIARLRNAMAASTPPAPPPLQTLRCCGLPAAAACGLQPHHAREESSPSRPSLRRCSRGHRRARPDGHDTAVSAAGEASSAGHGAAARAGGQVRGLPVDEGGGG